MKAIINENLKCSMFREIIEQCSAGEIEKICSPLDDPNAEYKQVLRTLLLLFFINREEAPVEGDDATGNDRRSTNTTIEGLMNNLINENLKDIDQSTDDERIDLRNDSLNKGALAILEHSFSNRTDSYIYRNSFVNAMCVLDNDDTIQTRLDKLKRKFEDKIDDSNFNEQTAVQEAANEEETEGTDLKVRLKETSKRNLQKYCEKLLNIINNALNPETYYMTQLQIEALIKSGHTQIILTGAPGTGKTRMAKDIAKHIGSCLPWESVNQREAEYEFVQFHPSYDYTDFVEGLRPIQVNDQITFRKMDGIFKRFCRWAAYQNKIDGNGNERKYFFIIDEINRADLSKVFGELMYCLESDKRGEENLLKTQYQNLQTHFDENYLQEKIGDASNIKKFTEIFKEGFYIPKNVVVIGTMNDIDRSVESMDYALRRRFIWKEIEVNEIFLESAFRSMFRGKTKLNVEKLAERIMNLNRKLEEENKYGLSKHYYISQGQFSGLLNTALEETAASEEEVLDKFIEEAWDNNIKLLIAEYVRGEDGVDVFLKECKNALKRNGESAQ